MLCAPQSDSVRNAPGGLNGLLGTFRVIGNVLSGLWFPLFPAGPSSNGYSGCEIWQATTPPVCFRRAGHLTIDLEASRKLSPVLKDFRSMLSFLLGALLCCLMTKDKGPDGEPVSRQGFRGTSTAHVSRAP